MKSYAKWVTDFDGFDRLSDKRYWIAASDTGGAYKVAIVLAKSWYRARAAAVVVFGREIAEVELVLAEGKTVVPRGDCIIVSDETGHTQTFKTKRRTSCEKVGRGEDVREREWVGGQRGRKVIHLADRVQKDGQKSVHPATDGGKASKGASARGRKDVRPSGRDGVGKTRGHKLGGPSRSTW